MVDIDRKGYLILKHKKNRKLDFGENNNFIADKIKLVLNKKNELVLISTTLTVDLEVYPIILFLIGVQRRMWGHTLAQIISFKLDTRGWVRC